MPNISRLGWGRDTKFDTIISNKKLLNAAKYQGTAFMVSELLIEKGEGYFKDARFKFEPHVCNKCHDILMIAYKLKSIAILNVKGVDFRCFFMGY